MGRIHLLLQRESLIPTTLFKRWRLSIIMKHKKQRRKKDLLAVHAGLGANFLLAVLKNHHRHHRQKVRPCWPTASTPPQTWPTVLLSPFSCGCQPNRRIRSTLTAMSSWRASPPWWWGPFVMTTAIAIFWNSLNDIFEILTAKGPSTGAGIMALWVAIFTVGLKTVLTFWTLAIGRTTRNSAVLALAADHRNDVFASLAATAGIFFGRMGHAWVDPLAGAVVSLIILHTGIEILRNAAGELMDTLPGDVLGREMRMLITPIPGVEQVEEIKTHRFGPYLVANITIGVNGQMTVAQGDHISTQVEKQLLKNIELMRRVYVHYHPTREVGSG